MDIPPQPANQPANPNPGRFKLAKIVICSTILLLIIIGLLLPALGAARRAARCMTTTSQARGITQGMITYAGGNKERMPGLNGNGYLIRDVDGDNDDRMPFTSHGGTVEGRFWLMLDNNNFSGDYIISPAETKTPWTTGPVTSANYSYAMLNIHDGSTSPSSAMDKIRPNQIGRARAWKQSINTQAVLVADRARIPGGRIGDSYDKIYSIHTSEDDEEWAGSVGRGDGSAWFEQGSATDTKYGDGSAIEYDRLFAREQTGDRDYDQLIDPGATWDDTANALLGYTSVGYEDPDIASE